MLKKDLDYIEERLAVFDGQGILLSFTNLVQKLVDAERRRTGEKIQNEGEDRATETVKAQPRKEAKEGGPPSATGSDRCEEKVEDDGSVFVDKLTSLSPLKTRVRSSVVGDVDDIVTLSFVGSGVDTVGLCVDVYVGDITIDDVLYVKRTDDELHVGEALGGSETYTWHVFGVGAFPRDWLSLPMGCLLRVVDALEAQ